VIPHRRGRFAANRRETPEGMVSVNGKSVTFEAAPKEIVTVVLRL
jgi:hypothetical protein